MPRRIGCREIAHEPFRASAPGMQHVQDDRLFVEAGISVRYRFRQRARQRFAQFAEHRRLQRIVTGFWRLRSAQRIARIGDIKIADQHRAQRRERSGNGRILELRDIQRFQRGAAPRTQQRRERGPLQGFATAVAMDQGVDRFGIDVARFAGRQHRAGRFDVVERRGDEHVRQFERTPQPHQPERRQCGIRANKNKIVAGKPVRGDFQRADGVGRIDRLDRHARRFGTQAVKPVRAGWRSAERANAHRRGGGIFHNTAKYTLVAVAERADVSRATRRRSTTRIQGACGAPEGEDFSARLSRNAAHLSPNRHAAASATLRAGTGCSVDVFVFFQRSVLFLRRTLALAARTVLAGRGNPRGISWDRT